MNTINCDRCGKEIEKYQSVDDEVLLNGVIDSYGDYCEECTEILVEKIQDILAEKDNDRPKNNYFHTCFSTCPFRGTITK